MVVAVTATDEGPRHTRAIARLKHTLQTNLVAARPSLHEVRVHHPATIGRNAAAS
jgi:hypothetical protein